VAQHSPCRQSRQPDEMTFFRQNFLHFFDELVQAVLVLFDPERSPAVEVPQAAAHHQDINLCPVIVRLEVLKPFLQGFAPDSSDEHEMNVNVVVLSETGGNESRQQSRIESVGVNSDACRVPLFQKDFSYKKSIF
jgi:hypothetical protein